MKAKITVTGYIDIPDTFSHDGPEKAAEQTEFWFNEHLSAEDAIGDVAMRLKAYPDDLEISVDVETGACRKISRKEQRY